MGDSAAVCVCNSGCPVLVLESQFLSSGVFYVNNSEERLRINQAVYIGHAYIIVSRMYEALERGVETPPFSA